MLHIIGTMVLVWGVSILLMWLQRLGNDGRPGLLERIIDRLSNI